MNILFEKTLYKGNGHWTIKAVEGYTGGLGPEDGMLISHATKEGGKETSKFKPTKGKNTGRSNATTAASQAVLEAQARVEKQRDKGYVNTREQAQSGPALNQLGKRKPQLSLDWEKVKDLESEVDWSTAYLQPKLDGNRALYDELLYSRPGKELSVLTHFTKALEGTPLAKLHLDGEAYTHGVPLQQITGYCKKLQQGTLELDYWIYDVVSDKPFPERYADLTEAFLASDVPPHIRLTPTIKVNSYAEAMKLHDKWVKDGFEGSILRWGTEGYQDDTRSKYSIKIKDFADLEVEIIDFRWGTPNAGPEGGQYLNPVLTYRLPGTDITGEASAPGTHAEKHQDGLNIEQRMGKLLTLRHKGFTMGGVPNIATAKCWYDPV